MSTNVSVCLCTYKRKTLSATLTSLANQQLPADLVFDVVVVDNDPAGSALEQVNLFRAAYPNVNLQYVVEKAAGIAHARNCAVRHARGPWLAFIDDDEEADSDWLARLIEAADKFRSQVVIGAVEARYPASSPRWIVHGDYFGRKLPLSGSQVRAGGAGNALILRGVLPRNTGPFNPAYGTTGGEDTELFFRLSQQGERIVTCREARVIETVETHRLNMRFLLRKAIRVGETYGRIFFTGRSRYRRLMSLLRALVQVVLAAALTLLLLPLGRRYFFHFAIKAMANWGKVRYFLNRQSVELYKAA